MIKYNNNSINDWYFDTSDIVKVYRNNVVRYQKIYSGSTTKILAHLTLNDGSIVDIEDDGTGALKKRMMSAYSTNTVSVEILSGCTRLEMANSTGTFQTFSQLTAVTMPDTLITIDSNAFLSTSLVDVVVPDSVQTINGGAFARISTLQSITFGSGCTSIGRAMTQESKQTKIIFKSPTNPISNYDFWFYHGARNGVIEYPCDGTGYDVMMANFKKKTTNVGNNGTVNTWTEQCKQYNNKI